MTHAAGLLRDRHRRTPPRSSPPAPLHTGLRRAPPRRASSLPLLVGFRRASSLPRPFSTDSTASPLPSPPGFAAPPPHRAPPLHSPSGSAAPPPCRTLSRWTPPRLLPASHRAPLRPSPLDASASALLAFPTELPF
ncbi:hypothetical protein GUJ93_ZPchr0002g24662 [Zizania palustris]|uniref:Uncharacterized protein n=1 Tax=Zizania palustris TaxID=103762 RepID=A0A8J5SAS3_ZIZPA|nr:hypothetical protein GUJ93_ZPchr0002g24662 [Zizania palustris]